MFKLYGPGNVIDDTHNKYASDAECFSDDLQSMRIRLAVMKAKEQLEKENEDSSIRQEAIGELDANLRDILASESSSPSDTKEENTISPKTKSLVKKNIAI